MVCLAHASKQRQWILKNNRVVILAVNCCLASGSRWVSSSPVWPLGCRACRPPLLWWTNTMVFSINVAAVGLLSSTWQTSDADWARGDETWLSIGCLLVVSLTVIDIIECCQIWNLRLNQCLLYHRRILKFCRIYISTRLIFSVMAVCVVFRGGSYPSSAKSSHRLGFTVVTASAWFHGFLSTAHHWPVALHVLVSLKPSFMSTSVSPPPHPPPCYGSRSSNNL